MVVEKMYCRGEERMSYRKGSLQFDDIVSRLKERFGEMDTALWLTATTGQWNEIYQDTVVSVVFRRCPPYLDHLKPVVSGRKFFMEKGWIYDKVYSFADEDCSLPVPSGSTRMGTGHLVNVYGQPGDADLTRYKDVYFSHPDHKLVEVWGSCPLPQGAYSTFYGATVDTADRNKVLRVKAYNYDEQGELSDWDVSYMMYLKRTRIESGKAE